MEGCEDFNSLLRNAFSLLHQATVSQMTSGIKMQLAATNASSVLELGHVGTVQQFCNKMQILS